MARSASRLADKNRRDPGRRRTVDPLAAAALGRAVASRGRVVGRRHEALALAAHFLDAGADCREIVGGAQTAHWLLPLLLPVIVEPKAARGQTPSRGLPPGRPVELN